MRTREEKTNRIVRASKWENNWKIARQMVIPFFFLGVNGMSFVGWLLFCWLIKWRFLLFQFVERNVHNDCSVLKLIYLFFCFFFLLLFAIFYWPLKIWNPKRTIYVVVMTSEMNRNRPFNTLTLRCWANILLAQTMNGSYGLHWNERKKENAKPYLYNIKIFHSTNQASTAKAMLWCIEVFIYVLLYVFHTLSSVEKNT